MDNNTTHDMEPLYNIYEKADAHDALTDPIDGVDLNSNIPNQEREDPIKKLAKQNGDGDDNGGDSQNPPKATKIKGCFAVLTKSDIKMLQMREINKVSSVLMVPKSEACLLLTHYGWSAMNVHEAWFDNEARARELVGLVCKDTINPEVTINEFESKTCKICFDTLSFNKMKSVKCGHVFCINCWNLYIDTKILEGPSQCLKLKCPALSCNVAVDCDMIRRFASESNREKYDRFLLRSFVEGSMNRKWCPNPGCGFALAYEPDDVDRNFLEATCLCYHRFCWKCGEEAHRPLSCEAVRDWVTKNETESKSTLWIFDFTKPCPCCNQPIEKQGGCMHMSCILCGYQFCWLCLRRLADCAKEGRCNSIYAAEIWNLAPPEGGDDDEEIKELEVMENRRKKTKIYKYTHYYERWANNEFSMKKATETLVSRINNAQNIRMMCKAYNKYDNSSLAFLSSAWEKIIECRRVLKWTYAYGYFLSQREEEEEAKKEFFEYSQGVAENALEKLHQYAETVLKVLLSGEEKDEFDKFRTKLRKLTKVTSNFFENMVKALEENKLDDVKVKKYSGVKREIDEANDDDDDGGGDGGGDGDGDGDGDVVEETAENDINRWRCRYCGRFNASTTSQCPCRRRYFM